MSEIFLGELPAKLIIKVLRRLNVPSSEPSVQQLHTLLAAYVRTVPWESAFRIAKRAKTDRLEDCARFPLDFWNEHLDFGSGGTCFESNYAFYALLRSQGFHGYLTINDMAHSVACHTAIIIQFAHAKWVVDAGFPLYAPIPLAADKKTYAQTPFMNYSITPLGNERYQILRFPHPKEDAFTLIDKPVDEGTYREATTADYLPTGHFLKRVIIHKILDEVAWRFNSEERPYCLQYFQDAKRFDLILTGNLAGQLGEKFSMDRQTLAAALEISGTQPERI